ncbi:MAG: hypothetical protein JNN15_18285, partial [Blastocatellia bacterium]|nr:hypothetical protein [Blastocatellia bacterium]
MGILDRIFKSLLGRDTEPSESQKRQETVSTSYPVERQSVPTQPATAELKPESTPVSRVEKTVEKPSEAPVTAVHQPFVVQTTGSPSSSPNVESLQSEYVAPPPTFEQQLSETASTPSPMANEVDIYQPDVTESENFSEPGFELPQELFNDPADIGDFVEPVETSETSTTTANPFD